MEIPFGRGARAVLAGTSATALAGVLVVAAPVTAQVPGNGTPAPSSLTGEVNPSPPAKKAKTGGNLKVMTQNLYLGADLFPAVEAAQKGTVEFLLAAAKVYQEAMASDFPTRAKALAKTVKQKRPDIIGLQEVTQWISSRPASTGPALPSVDFLKTLNKALKAEGLAYKVVGVSDNASLGPFPYIDPAQSCGAPTGVVPTTWPCAIQMKDRDVILVNTQKKGLTYTKKSVKTGQYSTQQEFTVAGQTISFSRGYVYLDMAYKGAMFRMANTHLEVGEESAPIQEAQAKQFVKIVQKGGPKQVVATGDFNSDAYGTYSPKSYQILTKSYFTDSWKKSRDGLGLSCCQNADLSNTVSEADSRIDLVLTHGKVKSRSGVNTNAKPFRSAPVPLWESDHAGVVVRLTVS